MQKIASSKQGQFAHGQATTSENLKQLMVKAYPNPSNGKFHFSLVNAADGEAIARLFDAFGKEVGRQTILIHRGSPDVEMQFDAPHLTAGYYTYRVVDAGGRLATGQLIIAR